MNNPEYQKQTYSPFWPMLLVTLSLALVLLWNLILTVQQCIAAVRLRDQQESMVVQAAQAEERLKQMMVDLLLLAKTDPEAATIVSKYRIAFTPPAASASSVAANTAAPVSATVEKAPAAKAAVPAEKAPAPVADAADAPKGE